MRVMFILRGAQGCGKSTLPATLGLDSKVLGFDMFRNLSTLSVPPSTATPAPQATATCTKSTS